MIRLPRLARPRFLRDETGAVTVDFVLVFPMLMMVFLASFEAGMLTTRYVMLDRALDLAVRELRLGHIEDPTHAKIKTLICNNTVIMPDCEANLKLELRPVSRTNWDVFDTDPDCTDRTAEVKPPRTFDPGGSNQLMLVRACAIFDPFFPTTPWGLRLKLDRSGGYQMIAASGFVNEPRLGGN